MASKASALPFIFGLAAIGILAVVFIKPKSSKASTAGSGGSSGGTSGVWSPNFPVNLQSDPRDILAAFQASGYFDQLSSDQQAAARNNPIDWLKNHSYLRDYYPGYFKSQSSGNYNYVSPWGR